MSKTKLPAWRMADVGQAGKAWVWLRSVQQAEDGLKAIVALAEAEINGPLDAKLRQTATESPECARYLSILREQLEARQRVEMLREQEAGLQADRKRLVDTGRGGALVAELRSIDAQIAGITAQLADAQDAVRLLQPAFVRAEAEAESVLIEAGSTIQATKAKDAAAEADRLAEEFLQRNRDLFDRMAVVKTMRERIQREDWARNAVRQLLKELADGPTPPA